nr:MAG TPA: hypothetical protein [Caudoviricetes sp.]
MIEYRSASPHLLTLFSAVLFDILLLYYPNNVIIYLERWCTYE